MFVLSERLVVLCFGEAFYEAAAPLRLVAPGVVLSLPITAYGYVFTALGRQRLYMGCVAVSLAVNTLLDLLLIPFYSYQGAAIATLSAEAVLFLTSPAANFITGQTLSVSGGLTMV